PTGLAPDNLSKRHGLVAGVKNAVSVDVFPLLDTDGAALLVAEPTRFRVNGHEAGIDRAGPPNGDVFGDGTRPGGRQNGKPALVVQHVKREVRIDFGKRMDGGARRQIESRRIGWRWRTQ